MFLLLEKFLFKVKTNHSLLQETLQTFNQIKISKVQLIWIPSHGSTLGGEGSDALAKTLLNMPLY